MGKTLSLACATMAVGLPIALAVIIKGGAALIWLLQSLPQG